MAMEIDEVIEEIKSIVTVNTEKQAEALNWAINYMTLLKSALKDYKDRKVEKLAMLEEIQLEIEGLEKPHCHNASHADGCVSKWKVEGVIQQKINALKGE